MNVLPFPKSSNAQHQLDLFGHYSEACNKYSRLDVPALDQSKLFNHLVKLDVNIILDLRSLSYFPHPKYEVLDVSMFIKDRGILYIQEKQMLSSRTSFSLYKEKIRRLTGRNNWISLAILVDPAAISSPRYSKLVSALQHRRDFIEHLSA